jgi:hypothetical protein
MLARTPWRTPVPLPCQRKRFSASTRRYARGVKGVTGWDSCTQAPWQSPYTPLVDPYTQLRGQARRSKLRNKARVRGSDQPSVGGGAKCTIRVAKPAKRRRLLASSRLPSKGKMPCPLSTAQFSGDEVKAMTRNGAGANRATRWPTSPQPTINSRWRRKRAGKAPSGVWFEGKIAVFAKNSNPKDTQT